MVVVVVVDEEVLGVVVVVLAVEVDSVVLVGAVRDGVVFEEAVVGLGWLGVGDE